MELQDFINSFHRHVFDFDQLMMECNYHTACYVCGIEFGFKFGYPIGNTRLMLIEHRNSTHGDICAPVCSEECRLAYQTLMEMAK